MGRIQSDMYEESSWKRTSDSLPSGRRRMRFRAVLSRQCQARSSGNGPPAGQLRESDRSNPMRNAVSPVEFFACGDGRDYNAPGDGGTLGEKTDPRGITMLCAAGTIKRTAVNRKGECIKVQGGGRYS